ncbi:hypothetical protein [Rhodoferax sp. U11-2br]|uniref:hypothetical protein n=1 Tax=Rhodoferax sp. U11-2br TaxID=2838878 RepID=UPI001BEC683E|nr:hypothetical protein [Rhodoferax sp. U11-2br]MBT3067992.1 hypothetical protein [Rhodoferax sp. U11-2br]
MTLQHLLAWMRFQRYRHGWLAVLGLALFIGALGLQFLGVEQMHTRLAELRAEAAAQRQQDAQRPDPDDTARQRRAAFDDSLPGSAGALDAIEVVHRIALANGVKLATGEYRLVRDGGTKVQRYQITLPARASYPQLRAWLAEVMNAVPAMALNDIGFQREEVGSESVQANVRFSLFLRGP